MQCGPAIRVGALISSRGDHMSVKSPPGSEWELRGSRNRDVVLHSGITEYNASHLLRGKTDRSLDTIAVGEETSIKFDDLALTLVRTA